MNADVITSTTYPHGTIKGFQGGCNTAHCPAEVSCRTVHTRYVGDWAFRRQINAGMTPVEIVAAERKQAQEAADADLAAKKAKGARQSAETREAARERHNAARRAKRAANLIPQKALIPRDKLAALLGEGLTDRQIGERLGFTRRQVAGARNTAKLPRNPDSNRRPAPATTGGFFMKGETTQTGTPVIDCDECGHRHPETRKHCEACGLATLFGHEEHSGSPAPLKIGSLFSGVGGLDLAVESFFGGETVWHCEWEAEPSKVLAAHWPGVPNFGDVTAVDWSNVEPVDIICGGFPCQDLSLAGRRSGMRPGTRSGLWADFRKAIAVLRPSVVIIENVRGLLSGCAESESDSELGQCPRCVDPDGGASHSPNVRALGRVLGDLSTLGFDAEWHGLLASDVVPLMGGSVSSFLPTPAAYDSDRGGTQSPEKRRAGGHQPSLADVLTHL